MPFRWDAPKGDGSGSDWIAPPARRMDCDVCTNIGGREKTWGVTAAGDGRKTTENDRKKVNR